MPSRTKGPYTVWLVTPDDAIAVSARVPRFSRSHRGGYKEGSIRLYEPLKSTNPLLAPMSKLRIDDARTGRTAWEGYVDLPGKQRGDEGDVWEIGAVGPKARLDDVQRQYVAIDRSFEGWEEGFKTKANMTQGVGDDPNAEDVDALVINFPDGLVIAAGDPTSGPRAQMKYRRIAQAGQFVGGVSFNHREGNTNGTLRSQLAVSTSGVGGSFEVARNRVFATTLDEIAAVAGRDFDLSETGKDVAFFRMLRDSGTATNISNDTWWTAARDIRVSALRRGQDANWIYDTAAYPGAVYDVDYVLAHDVIIDALFWFCATFTGAGVEYVSPIDIANASIDQTFTHHIDQLVYNDPISLGQILEDLALFEPDMVWEVLETQPNGAHRFALRRLLDGGTIEGSNESGPRYIATSDDGWDQPGSEADLRNSVTVSWTDELGNQQSKTYTAEVPEVDQWGIVREGPPIELADELGSEANADRIGPKYLEEAAKAVQSGTLTIATQKVHDAWNGRDVEAWEIEPGYSLLINDLEIMQPITDIEVEDNTAQLTLSEPVLTDEQLVNMYARRDRRRS